MRSVSTESSVLGLFAVAGHLRGGTRHRALEAGDPLRGVKPSGDPHFAARKHSGKGSRSARDRCLWVSGSSADHARAAPVETEKGGIEMKHRAGGDAVIIPLDEVVFTVRAELDKLWEHLRGHVRDVEYRE